MNSIEEKPGRKSKLSTVVKKKEIDVEYVSSSTLPKLPPGQNSTEVNDNQPENDNRKKPITLDQTSETQVEYIGNDYSKGKKK